MSDDKVQQAIDCFELEEWSFDRLRQKKMIQQMSDAGLALVAEVKRLQGALAEETSPEQVVENCQAYPSKDFSLDKITQLENARHKDQETLRQIACRPHSSFTDSGWREHALRRVASLEKMYQDAKRNIATISESAAMFKQQAETAEAERGEIREYIAGLAVQSREQDARLAKADELAEACNQLRQKATRVQTGLSISSNDWGEFVGALIIYYYKPKGE